MKGKAAPRGKPAINISSFQAKGFSSYCPKSALTLPHLEGGASTKGQRTPRNTNLTFRTSHVWLQPWQVLCGLVDQRLVEDKAEENEKKR